ncbi:MAG: PD-(D/E)XK nuclease family protein [Verrucomicrobia bacterium]|nr:PD-(D/E)XK nuclease family protein [Verrucomicrobiota bacterium]
MVSSGAVHLFHNVEDAWQAGLAAEVERLSRRALAGCAVWFVTGSFPQAHWIRSRQLRAGRSLFGLEFINLRSVRQRLCRRNGLPSPSFGRETLRLILQNALGEEPVHASMADHLLVALDEFALLGFTCEGRLEEVLRLLRVPGPAWETVSRLFHSEYWRPRVDERLRRIAAPSAPPFELCVFGLGSLELRQMDLLIAAAKSAEAFTFWLPQPLTTGDPDFRNLERLERETGAPPDVCPSSGIAEPFGWVLEAWQGFSGPPGQRPQLVCAHRPADEVDAVVQLVAGSLVSGCQDVLVAVPEHDPFGAVIVDALSAANIAVADEVRRDAQASFSVELQKTLVQLHGRDRSLRSLWRMFELWVEDESVLARLRHRLARHFDERQSTVLEVILPGLVPPEWEAGLIRLLRPWPECAPFEELACAWRQVLDDATALASSPGLRRVCLDTGDLEPLWHEVAEFLRGQSISGRLFAGFLYELLNQPRRLQLGAGRTARVCVASAAQALGTAYDAIIVPRCSGEGWPRVTTENPLLTDLARAEMESRYHFTWHGPAERRRLELDQYLHLLVQARKELSFTYTTADELDDMVVPNEIITFLQSGLHARQRTFRPAERTPPAPVQGLDQFAAVWARRTDPNAPFDEYSLAFGGLDLPLEPWSPSALDAVWNQPATFAFRHVFGCEREHDREFRREFGLTLGKLVHRWMRSVFAGAGSGGSPLQTALALGIPSVQCTSDLIRDRLRQRLREEQDAYLKSLSDGRQCLWWDSVVRQAGWACERLIDQISEPVARSPWLAAECPVEATLPLPEPLALRGRIDLVLLDQADLKTANLLVVDFKTSARQTAVKLAEGYGLQFYGYHWICEHLAGKPPRVLVARIGANDELNLTAEQEKAGTVRTTLARIQGSACFGLGNGSGEHRDDAEALPLAAVPISSAVLREKRKRTFA